MRKNETTNTKAKKNKKKNQTDNDPIFLGPMMNENSQQQLLK